jgi:stearoyl-CoA desaturase (delta-9 desaturase)
MMKPVLRIDSAGASPCLGRPVIDAPKAAWNGAMLVVAAGLGPVFFNWSALAVFLVATYLTLLVGHSVGMHRMMIHRSFAAPKPVERAVVWIGVLVGLGGPFSVIRIHDTRDWAQRQGACHDFFAHRRPLLADLGWNLFCRFEFETPPRLTIEPNLADDPWHRFFERTWRLHQLPVAALLYLGGGWPWVVWGVAARIIASTAGHWTITYFCHNPGAGRWRVNGACVQAANLPGLGLVTMGECWHNNHHAFPESARIGLERGQVDPAWWVIRALERMGLARQVGSPRDEASREDLIGVPQHAANPCRPQRPAPILQSRHPGRLTANQGRRLVSGHRRAAPAPRRRP